LVFENEIADGVTIWIRFLLQVTDCKLNDSSSGRSAVFLDAFVNYF